MRTSLTAAIVLMLLALPAALRAEVSGGCVAWRTQVAAGTGWDNVGGYGTSGVGYSEVGGRLEIVLFPHFVAAVGASARVDWWEYDHALEEEIQTLSPGLVVQTLVGFTSRPVGIRLGIWWEGQSRGGEGYRAGWIYPRSKLKRIWRAGLAMVTNGVFDLRLGNETGHHVRLSTATGVAFAAEGGPAVHLDVGWRHDQDHRRTFGLYVTPFEFTGGVALALNSKTPAVERLMGIARTGLDEVRVSLLIGTDIRHAFGRNEIGVSLGWGQFGR